MGRHVEGVQKLVHDGRIVLEIRATVLRKGSLWPYPWKSGANTRNLSQISSRNLDENVVESIKVEQIHGFTVRWKWTEKTGKKKQREILSLSDGVCSVSLDDEITLKDGRAGKVLKFVWPYTEGRSTDIIRVHLGRSHGFYWVKHEEVD